MKRVEKDYSAFKIWNSSLIPKLMKMNRHGHNTKDQLKVGDIIYIKKEECELSSNWTVSKVAKIDKSKYGLVRRVSVQYQTHGENFPRFTDQSVRSLKKLFHIDDQNWQDDMALVEKLINELQKDKDGNIMRCAKCDLAYATHGMYRLHMQQYHDKALTCEECGKKITLPNSLNKHRLNYHTSFPKTCDDCGQFCATKQEFVVHLANVHGQGMQQNTVPCKICGKLDKNKNVLKQHVSLVHERKGGEFPCVQCGKILKSEASLEYHSRRRLAMSLLSATPS